MSTADGRVKVFGAYGLEISFNSSVSAPTRLLSFLPNSGALLRLAKVRFLALLLSRRIVVSRMVPWSY